MIRHTVTAKELTTNIETTLAGSTGKGKVKKLIMHVNTYTGLSRQGGALECVYVSPSQGVFRQRDGYLAIIALGHLKSGEFKLRQ